MGWRAGAQRASAARLLRQLVAAAAVSCSVIAVSVPAFAEGANQAAQARGSARKQDKTAVPAAPSKLLGKWEVKRVLLDLADQSRWGTIHPEFPALLYRSMTITADKITFADKDVSCDQTSWQPLATTWLGLFQTTDLSRLPREGAAIPAKPADYDLKVSERQRVQAYPLCPRAPLTTAKSWQGAYWMALQGEELVVRYGKQLILVLRKRRADEKPQASFACEKATSPTEKAICSDVETAGWDRSVAEALRQALEQKPESKERERIEKDQQKWKSQRDACGADLACIRKSCDQRAMALVTEARGSARERNQE
jgi:hypothetical protein